MNFIISNTLQYLFCCNIFYAKKKTKFKRICGNLLADAYSWQLTVVVPENQYVCSFGLRQITYTGKDQKLLFSLK